MNIYLVERTDKVDWDEYFSFVCTAKTSQDAENHHPDDSKYKSGWIDDDKKNTLKVTKIGKALTKDQYLKPRVILASFNAG